MDHWSESYQNTSRHCAEREGNNIRDDAMAEQIRLSLVLSASFHFIIERLVGKQREPRLTNPFVHTSVTSSCAFNFKVGQRQGNVIQLLAKTSSSMCILWTV